MEILESLEARWFLAVDSALAAELNACFKNAPLENDGDRVDHYYVDPARSDLNAKARGGDKPKLEYKYRVGTLGSMSLGANVTGDVERWTKLSLSTDAGLSKESQIITVSKQRRRRKFAFDGTKVAEVGIKEMPDAGCGVEFTVLKAVREKVSREACTFGFEAFGPPPVSLEALAGSVRAFLAEAPPNLRLRASQSDNYSTWLIRQFATWSHRIKENTPYYDNPAQARPPNGELLAGTLCRVVQEAGSYVVIMTTSGSTVYVAASALEAG